MATPPRLRLPLENLEASVGAAHQEVADQLTTASGLEARLLGFLGLLVAISGVLLTVPDGLASYRWILLIAASGGVAIILIGLTVAKKLDFGPNANRLYEKYGAEPPDKFLKRLLDELGEAISVNTRRTEGREALFAAALTWVVIFAIWFGLVQLPG